MTDSESSPPKPTIEDRRLLYGIAHHDVWWAKGQQWNVTNWSLVLMGATVGVARSLFAQAPASLSDDWPFLTLLAVIAIAGVLYLTRLFSEIVHNRDVYRALESTTGIALLREELPKLKKLHSDKRRGIGFLYIMIAAIAIGAGLAAMLLALPECWALVFTLCLALLGVVRAERAA